MHLCYVDDSGDSRRGVLLTALIVEDSNWSRTLRAWLIGRREIHRVFGVPKLRELHANQLYKGRGTFCETTEQNARFGDAQRAAVGRMMLSHLSKNGAFVLFSVGTSDRSPSVAYAKLIARLEDWADDNATELMVFYDGRDGSTVDHHASAREKAEFWEQAIRAAAPYRRAHRALDLASRRVIEDVVMQDSRFSQFIQAADLLAYGAFHKHVQSHPEIWGDEKEPCRPAIKAYMQASSHWPEDSDDGVYWLG
ncbi:DUF3800 domain-containing protein [Leifsonia sp. RAF41]|uniref:DUF3800 domain-containing protein n=1 Tax=Leifsonia sp. RAF41 TaxID=3233056 RepID=UPI003F9C5273